MGVLNRICGLKMDCSFVAAEVGRSGGHGASNPVNSAGYTLKVHALGRACGADTLVLTVVSGRIVNVRVRPGVCRSAANMNSDARKPQEDNVIDITHCPGTFI